MTMRKPHANPSNVIVQRAKQAGRFDVWVGRAYVGQAEHKPPQAVALPPSLSRGERSLALQQIAMIINARRDNPSTFWGRAGAGAMFHCVADDTYLLTLRSSDVEQPGTWGVPGGACGKDGFYADSEGRAIPTATALKCALREAKEELGWIPEAFAEREAIVFQQGGFRYTTFILDVSAATKRKMDERLELNWENDDALWFTPAQAGKMKLHFGVEYVLAQLEARG